MWQNDTFATIIATIALLGIVAWLAGMNLWLRWQLRLANSQRKTFMDEEELARLRALLVFIALHAHSNPGFQEKYLKRFPNGGRELNELNERYNPEPVLENST